MHTPAALSSYSAAPFLIKGYQDMQFMKRDKRLEPLRSHPEFEKLLKEFEISA
jgi:hypothetical protein